MPPPPGVAPVSEQNFSPRLRLHLSHMVFLWPQNLKARKYPQRCHPPTPLSVDQGPRSGPLTYPAGVGTEWSSGPCSLPCWGGGRRGPATLPGPSGLQRWNKAVRPLWALQAHPCPGCLPPFLVGMSDWTCDLKTINTIPPPNRPMSAFLCSGVKGPGMGGGRNRGEVTPGLVPQLGSHQSLIDS